MKDFIKIVCGGMLGLSAFFVTMALILPLAMKLFYKWGAYLGVFS